jgi:hypothetical protein
MRGGVPTQQEKRNYVDNRWHREAQGELAAIAQYEQNVAALKHNIFVENSELLRKKGVGHAAVRGFRGVEGRVV